MSERIAFYIDLLISACGFDGSPELPWLGAIVVTLAAAIVIYAFYRAIICSIWPGETGKSHIKYSILDESF